MADYKDSTGWEKTARLYFTQHGSAESFPLPGVRRRFVLRTPFFIREYESDFLDRQIPRLCGVNLGGTEKKWESGFSVSDCSAGKFCKDRIFLCGDAAHIMSPIGGQNMNTGFADAEMAVWCVGQIKKNAGLQKRLLALYDRSRRKAARVAARRAGVMTALGTGGGRVWPFFRNALIFLALHSPFKPLLADTFTMQSIPNRNLMSITRLQRKSLRRPGAVTLP